MMCVDAAVAVVASYAPLEGGETIVNHHSNIYHLCSKKGLLLSVVS